MRRWPIHFKPLPDELLSSWLMRLIRAHGAEPERFGVNVWGYDDLWRRDLDLGYYHEIMGTLADCTATSIERIKQTTMIDYPGLPVERPRGRLGGLVWLLSVGFRGGRRRWPWLQYCPQCLREDAEPYFRRRWRFAFITVCEHHKRHLLDRCRSCGAPCNFFQLLTEKKVLTQCFQCGFDARRPTAPVIGRQLIYRRMLDFQVTLIQALHTGAYPLTATESVSAHWFFSMLKHLLRRLLSKTQSRERFQALCVSLNQPAFTPQFRSDYSRTIESLPLPERSRLMVLLAAWFNHWPQSFISAFPSNDKPLAELMRMMLFRPEWQALLTQNVTSMKPV